jgi:hypothetical protein
MNLVPEKSYVSHGFFIPYKCWYSTMEHSIEVFWKASQFKLHMEEDILKQLNDYSKHTRYVKC